MTWSSNAPVEFERFLRAIVMVGVESDHRFQMVAITNLKRLDGLREAMVYGEAVGIRPGD